MCIFHKWTKWVTKKENYYYRGTNDLAGVKVTQERECKKCGKIEMREVIVVLSIENYR